MKIKYKIISFIACLSILLSVISISAFAEAPYVYPPYDEIVTDGLSNVTYGSVGSYDAYKIQVGSVIPYSFFKNLYLSYDNGIIADEGANYMIFNIFCENNGTLQPLFTSELGYAIRVYCWNAPYNNNDANLKLSAGTGSNAISANFSKKPKYTITQDSDGYIYFKYTDSAYLKSINKYTTGNLFLMYAVGYDSYQNLIADCQRYYNNDSFIENESMYGATADFITFPKTSNDLGLIPLYLKSWLNEGYQYPYLEFYINSNSNHGDYSLTISSFDFDIYDKPQQHFDNGKGSLKLDKYCGAFYTTGNLTNDLHNISNALDLVPDVPVNPAWTSDRLAEFNRDGITFEIKHKLKTNLSFTNSVGISTESLNFTGSDDIVRYYSICLSDYLDISHKKIYRVDISNGSNILATTYFSSYDSFLRNATPVGNSHSVGYTDKSTFDNDASNGTYVSGTHSDINAFNNNDTPSISPNTNLYNNIGNADFFSSLDSTLKGLQGFFYGCYAIIPPAIISIILGSLALIIVMRVLGR